MTVLKVTRLARAMRPACNRESAGKVSVIRRLAVAAVWRRRGVMDTVYRAKSFLPQRYAWIEPGGALRRTPRCDGGDEEEEQGHSAEREGIGRFDADQHAGHHSRQAHRREQSDRDANRGEP